MINLSAIKKRHSHIAYVFRAFIRRMLYIFITKNRIFTRIRLFGLLSVMFFKELLIGCFPESQQKKGRFFGFRMQFPSYSIFCSLFETIFLRRDYEFKCSKESPLILDCGSHIGMSIVWFKWKYPKAHIIAFEPDAVTFNYLSNNVKENNLTNIDLHQKAVWSRDEQRVLRSDMGDPSSLGMSLFKRLYEKDNVRVDEIMVDCVELSKYIDAPVDILKLNIEGAEYEILSALYKNGKLGCISEMLIKYHYNESSPENSLSEILRILEASGFRYVIDSQSLKLPYPLYRKRHYFKLSIYAYLPSDVHKEH